MIDALPLAMISVLVLLALLFARWWVRHTADLCWMGALHPWTTLLTFVAVAVIANVLGALLMRSAGFVAARFALAVIVAPPFARYATDWIVWSRAKDKREGTPVRGAVFNAARAERRAAFLSTTVAPAPEDTDLSGSGEP